MSFEKEKIDKEIGEIKQLAEKLRMAIIYYKRRDDKDDERAIETFIDSTQEVINRLDAVQEKLGPSIQLED